MSLFRNNFKNHLCVKRSAMPRSSPALNPIKCADCNAEEPQWASVNRGVLICSECCYVHRNLGRHVSHIRSLKKGVWDSNQLELIYVLHSNGSNNIWEHSLLDPQSTNKIKKKPKPHDPVLPVKENFIKAKYAQLAFALRPSKEDDPINQEDLDRQLWSCVRTSHVETTLRLLVLGADPNYFDPEKRNSPLHIAAKEGQALQAELLWLYGADPGQPNSTDLTPSQVAKLENHVELSQRLEELQFEVTNKITTFLCARKPDHTRQQFFLIPELIGQSEDEKVLKARHQLSSLKPIHFERLVQDVYDEIDRRETVAAWNAVFDETRPFHLGIDQCVAVFLPPNPEFSATRNQLRQKLAKFNANELAIFIIDILKEAKRRYYGLPASNNSLKAFDKRKQSMDHITMLGFSERSASNRGSDNRDYDYVAEYDREKSISSVSNRRSSERKSGSSAGMLQAITNVSVDDYLEVKEKVLSNESNVLMLQQGNSEIIRMLTDLQSNIHQINSDMTSLQNEIKKSQRTFSSSATKRQQSPISSGSARASEQNASLCVKSYPMPAYGKPPIEPSRSEISSGYHSTRRRSSLASSPGAIISGTHSNRLACGRNGSAPPTEYGIEATDKDDKFLSKSGSDSSSFMRSEMNRFPRLNFQQVFDTAVFPDNLIVETEMLTQAIKMLLSDAQAGCLQLRAGEHAYAIALQVNRIIEVIPEKQKIAAIECSMQEMSDAALILSAKCNSPSLSVDDTCNAAYAVAKAAKELLVKVHQL